MANKNEEKDKEKRLKEQLEKQKMAEQRYLGNIVSTAKKTGYSGPVVIKCGNPTKVIYGTGRSQPFFATENLDS